MASSSTWRSSRAKTGASRLATFRFVHSRECCAWERTRVAAACRCPRAHYFARCAALRASNNNNNNNDSTKERIDVVEDNDAREDDYYRSSNSDSCASDLAHCTAPGNRASTNVHIIDSAHLMHKNMLYDNTPIIGNGDASTSTGQADVLLNGLSAVARAEMRAEIARDGVDGTAAVPPLAPRGWAVHHKAGTSTMMMTRCCPHTVTEPAARYRSIHDEHIDAYRNRSRSSLAQQTQSNSLGVVKSAVGVYHRSTHEGMMSGKSKDMAQSTALPSAVPVLYNVSLSTGTRRPMKSSSPFDNVRTSGGVARSDTHITVFVPFRVVDLSLLDPAVPICEWCCFDVLVSKREPRGVAEHHMQHNRSLHTAQCDDDKEEATFELQGQRDVWNTRMCLYLRLASVNSELRIRSAQLLSRMQARALEEHACFGKADPLFLELLRRERAMTLRRLRHRATSPPPQERNSATDVSSPTFSRSTYAQQRHSQCAHSHSIDDKTDTATDAAHTALTSFSTSSSSSFSHNDWLLSGSDPGTAARASVQLAREGAAAAEALLTAGASASGACGRGMCYGGPYVTELSKEMREALLSYVTVDLGITAELTEYVCQMQYFLEQEEYMTWLARCDSMAHALQARIVAPRSPPT